MFAGIELECHYKLNSFQEPWSKGRSTTTAKRKRGESEMPKIQFEQTKYVEYIISGRTEIGFL